jgi:hypothetical protein
MGSWAVSAMCTGFMFGDRANFKFKLCELVTWLVVVTVVRLFGKRDYLADLLFGRRSLIHMTRSYVQSSPDSRLIKHEHAI